jgi:hypothetical protein
MEQWLVYVDSLILMCNSIQARTSPLFNSKSLVPNKYISDLNLILQKGQCWAVATCYNPSTILH